MCPKHVLHEQPWRSSLPKYLCRLQQRALAGAVVADQNGEALQVENDILDHAHTAYADPGDSVVLHQSCPLYGTVCALCRIARPRKLLPRFNSLDSRVTAQRSTCSRDTGSEIFAESLRGTNVFGRDAVAGADLFDGHATGEAADQCANRNACATHNRLSAEYCCSSLEPFTEVHHGPIVFQKPPTENLGARSFLRPSDVFQGHRLRFVFRATGTGWLFRAWRDRWTSRRRFPGCASRCGGHWRRNIGAAPYARS